MNKKQAIAELRRMGYDVKPHGRYSVEFIMNGKLVVCDAIDMVAELQRDALIPAQAEKYHEYTEE